MAPQLCFEIYWPLVTPKKLGYCFKSLYPLKSKKSGGVGFMKYHLDFEMQNLKLYSYTNCISQEVSMCVQNVYAQIFTGTWDKERALLIGYMKWIKRLYSFLNSWHGVSRINYWCKKLNPTWAVAVYVSKLSFVE